MGIPEMIRQPYTVMACAFSGGKRNKTGFIRLLYKLLVFDGKSKKFEGVSRQNSGIIVRMIIYLVLKYTSQSFSIRRARWNANNGGTALPIILYAAEVLTKNLFLPEGITN